MVYVLRCMFSLYIVAGRRSFVRKFCFTCKSQPMFNYPRKRIGEWACYYVFNILRNSYYVVLVLLHVMFNFAYGFFFLAHDM